MALIDRVKDNLGITHTSLDTELARNIQVARRELIRLGVPDTAANSDDALVEDAVIACVCYKRTIGSDENAGWRRAWEYQSDCLRKMVWFDAECQD